MLRFLADENFNGDIVRGLFLREPDLDLIRSQDAGLSGLDDPSVLSRAAANDRIVLTHDRATMPFHAYACLAEGRRMAGVFVLNDRFPIGQAIQEILFMITCSEQTDWDGRVIHLPL